MSLAEATPIADPRALPTVTEKEDLRQSLMKRSRTDSVVLARSASGLSRTQSGASASSAASVGGAGPPPLPTPREDEEESPKEEDGHESRRRPMAAWSSSSSGGSANSLQPLDSEDDLDALERQDSRGLLEGGSPVEEEEGGDAAQAEADWFMNPQLSAERTRLRSLTVPRLKEELKAAGKIRTGKKAELMVRLVDATKEHWAAHGTILSECTGEVSPEPSSNGHCCCPDSNRRSGVCRR